MKIFRPEARPSPRGPNLSSNFPVRIPGTSVMVAPTGTNRGRTSLHSPIILPRTRRKWVQAGPPNGANRRGQKPPRSSPASREDRVGPSPKTLQLPSFLLRGSRRARSGLTGLGCWSDAFRLRPHFVPAGPRGVKSLKPHHIFHHFRGGLGVGMVFGTPETCLIGNALASCRLAGLREAVGRIPEVPDYAAATASLARFGCRDTCSLAYCSPRARR
jgi:hypothetical protein